MQPLSGVSQNFLQFRGRSVSGSLEQSAQNTALLVFRLLSRCCRRHLTKGRDAVSARAVSEDELCGTVHPTLEKKCCALPLVEALLVKLLKTQKDVLKCVRLPCLSIESCLRMFNLSMTCHTVAQASTLLFLWKVLCELSGLLASKLNEPRTLLQNSLLGSPAYFRSC